ncbi:universal stress protein [Hyunsoonleella aestuarii]|uniref:UspA domain-containing protein n=1 Tax=Hyunsoonleella aestuarii TaxID=912802 RepID=A0ABP8ECJ9_9FLAO|nr:universal stress protein [Hyunsoonleella aestuarii]
MKNVLLPTDFSENSWNAIKYAVRFFHRETCNFYLLHVNRLSDNFMNGSPYIANEDVLEEVYIKSSKQKLRKILRRIATGFETNKIHRFYSLSDYDFFIESIRKHVEEKNIDIIVMGTKGATGLKKIIVGSNTGDVITKVKCSILSVPEKAEFVKIEEIAFPTDFSLTYDIQILHPLSDILENHKAALRILHISKKKTNLNYDQKRNSELLDDYFNQIEHSFHYLTNKGIEDAIQCFTESRNTNMICMVAKNLNYFQQILFHSKIEEISYHTEIPFLVLHEQN